MSQLLPEALKGIDMAVYDFFSQAGLRVSALPILHKEQLQDEYEYDEELQETLDTHDIVGHALHELKVTNEPSYETEALQDVLEVWENWEFREVLWLNKPTVTDLAMAHMAVSLFITKFHGYVNADI